MWNPGLNDSRGLMISDVIIDEDLLVLNDGSPTWIPDSGRDPSCIDISLCSYDIGYCLIGVYARTLMIVIIILYFWKVRSS